MPETNNVKKAVTTENLAALADVLATKQELKKEVQKQVEDAVVEATPFEFATDEEVLALFQDTAEEEPVE